MQRMPVQKRIVFFLLKTVRGARALLVARAHVTGGRFAFRFRFRALEGDDFLRHLVLAFRRGRFFFLGLAAFFVSQAKE
jgi:hypothetical protein